MLKWYENYNNGKSYKWKNKDINQLIRKTWSISYKFMQKNPQQNISKSNPTMNQKNYTP